MPAVTVTIICRDEADRIRDAVACAAWADEVLVLDSGSTDGTPDLARAAGATVHVEAWRGYGAQKNRAAELARHDWILNCDADERIDPVTASAVRALGEPAHAVWQVRRRNRLAGAEIRRWPWSWDRQRRFYDRRRTAFSTAAVHESLTWAGSVGTLPGVLDHFTYRDWDDLLRRQATYNALWVAQAVAAGRRAGALTCLTGPAGTFLRHWLLRGYLLGGAQGWRLSLQAARAVRERLRRLAERTA